MSKYFRVCVYVATVALILLAGTRAGEAQAAIKNQKLKPILTVDVPIQELLDGYHAWVTSHPAARIKPIPIPGTKDVASREHLVIRSFAIDLYGRSGISLYHGIDASGNSAFIRGLPHNISNLAPTDETRPTLSEAMAMFKELQPYRSAYVASHQYILFSVQNSAKLSGSSQNAALQDTQLSAGREKVLVIDVRFHQ